MVSLVKPFCEKPSQMAPQLAANYQEANYQQGLFVFTYYQLVGQLVVCEKMWSTKLLATTNQLIDQALARWAANSQHGIPVHISISTSQFYLVTISNNGSKHDLYKKKYGLQNDLSSHWTKNYVVYQQLAQLLYLSSTGGMEQTLLFFN